MTLHSVQPNWCLALPLQQQSVLLLATRGPDGIAKSHPAKRVHVAYRGSTLVAAKFGRELHWGEVADGFMSLHVFAGPDSWADAVDDFLHNIDSLPLHYVLHLAHGAEILGFKHPDSRFRDRWGHFYEAVCETFHLPVETESQMDRRLADWGREHWAAP